MGIRVSKPGLLSQIVNDPRPALSPLQSQVDDLVSVFAQQATDWRSVAAMTVGGMTYRMGRIGTMSVGVQNFEPLRKIASVGIGLGAEVTAFEMTNRALLSLNSPTPPLSKGGKGGVPNLWRWEGHGGIRQGLLNSLVTFGTLKGAGRLAQRGNVVVQHLLQDTGMVLGHQTSGFFGITPRPTGSLAEQFLHAEATNLQLGAGMALAHSVAPGIQGLERGLDLSLRSTGAGVQNFEPLQIGSQHALATGLFDGIRASHLPEIKKGPLILQMSAMVSDPPLPPPPPPEVLVNGTPLKENYTRLDRLLRLLSERNVSSEELLPLLFRYPPGYRLKRLGFAMMSDGRLALQGEVEKIGGVRVATFDRVLVRHPDVVRSPLYAMGEGLNVDFWHQRKGIGTSEVLNEIDFYRALGIPYLLIPVGRQGGGYWPKLGFDFANSALREKLLGQFREYLTRQSIRLSLDETRRWPTIRHSWDLLDLKDDQGREVGKEFLMNPFLTWDSLFKLYDPDYPGWSLLGKAADKIGRPLP